ncbi:intraflagellar transport protein 22 homolog isoform X2 [Fopius arisanus]|uniref:Intraflagellar transport protein 22 homolog isoform X2 n=1 Tax=Fopius arisanus TaxID=64838 RepID=A0A9R1TH74_9HYME|nr:PREDICTED: intraflagellar transport protein 22 homolog isoform X2 [Fopius arisanus]
MATGKMDPIKLIVVGPAGSGKTTVANFLADASEIPFEYRPTQGVRILEFDVSNVNTKTNQSKVDIELWDCSGDRRFESCWSAFRRDTQGVIFVYSKLTPDLVWELEKLYDYFVSQTKLEPKNCVVFYFAGDKSHLDPPKRISPTFAKISQVNCNIEDDGNKLKSDFQTFLGTLMTMIQERKEQEESIILRGNTTFR